MRTWFLVALLLGLLTTTLAPAQQPSEALLTIAEKSNYQATSRHAEVMAFCEHLARISPVVRLTTFGTSVQGRKLPLLILADPPITTPAAAARSGKLVVFLEGNIHAGEVDGKEALLMLARELALAKDRPLLRDLVILIAPILNADGNDKMSKTNRPEQKGPPEVGERANAQGFDLNRDFVKLESPEVRAVVRLFHEWNPAVFIDMHTTNGSFHRYVITYDGSRHPATHPAIVKLLREQLLPAVGQKLKKETGYDSFFYGNFAAEHTRWETYPALPRFGLVYAGLQNRLGILCESYSYASYKDRVRGSKAFARGCLEYLAEHRKEISALLAETRRSTLDAGRNTRPEATLPLRFQPIARKEKVTILGYVEEEKNGKRLATTQPKDYPVAHVDAAKPTLSVARPAAYLFPPSYGQAVENLQRHGITVEELREDLDLEVEVTRVEKTDLGLTLFQNHRLRSLEASVRRQTRRVQAGTILVRTAQPLGTLAAYLLEPLADDGLGVWNFFDTHLKVGQDHPVLRLPAAVPLTVGGVRPLAEARKTKKPLTLEMLYNGKLPNLGGDPVSGITWLDDGEHFLQIKEGKLYKVHALSGKASLFLDADRYSKSLATIPGLSPDRVHQLARGPFYRMNPGRTGALLNHENDLYVAFFDGSKAIRLTRTQEPEELAEFSPDGKRVAFVRSKNLHVVDLATQTELALTKDASETVSNGQADWVYFEEIFNRNEKAFWWSPDSSRIVFIRFDDAPVHPFTVLNHLPVRQKTENTPYPKSGDPNPTIKLGIASAHGGPVRWIGRGNYSENASLVSRVGWLPSSEKVYFTMQDRAQTWLDLCTVSRDGGEPECLFREKTRAWVEDLGPPHFFKDGSFLWFSERSGWKHLYHMTAEGKLKAPVTSGPWEARTLHGGDPTEQWLYFSGTKDSHIGLNLYRIKPDGTGLTRLTQAPGDHRVQVSPRGNLFIDSWSDRFTPTRVQLAHTDGIKARMLDTNPVYAREEYQLARPEFVQIQTPDGFALEGMVMKPPHFDPRKRYPVWFKTYAGPHTPTIYDNWQGGRIDDQVMAQLGFVIFRMDPRSASGKGACSAWTAYRQLGVQELKDIEVGIKWLTAHPWVDPTRVGMSGHSYGGFITSYALTHSKLFAAGIAGAPVTDWHNYDSIYTERYMNTPQENPKGYAATSVVRAASKLHGKLLIVHGIMDDNVHVQNTIQLVDELQKANRDFELMMYPRARHPIHGKHYQKLLIEFMRRELKPGS